MKVQAPFLQTVAIAATLTLAIIAPNAANAASITHKTASFSFDEDTSEKSFFSVGSGLLPYFNASLGKLNSVTYQILGNSTANISITSNSNKKANASGRTFIYGQGVLRPQNVGLAGNSPGAWASIDGELPGKGATLMDIQTNNYDSWWWSSPSTLTHSFHLGLFTGIDNFAVDFNGYLNSYVLTTASRFTVDSSAATSGLSAMITYDYTPVPIPTPALLPGLLAMGVGVVRRRKAEAAAECEA